MLSDVINKLIDRMDNECNKIQNDDTSKKVKEAENTLEFINYIEKQIETNEANIIKLDLNKIIEIFKNNLPLLGSDIESFTQNFKELQVVIEAIYEEKIINSLTSEQTIFLNNFLESLNELKNIKTKILKKYQGDIQKNRIKTDDLLNRMIAFEDLKEKIDDEENCDILTEEDYTIFSNEIMNSRLSYNKQKEALISFIKYNIDRKNNIKKNAPVIDIESINEILSKYNLDSVIKLTKKEEIKNEIITKGNITKIEEILNYFNEEDILNKFNAFTLLSILIYGDLDFIKSINNEFRINGDLNGLIYENAGVWIQKSNSEKVRRGFKRKSNNEATKIPPLFSRTRTNSYEDIIANEQFLKDKGFNVSIKDKNNIALLTNVNTQNVQERYNILDEYGTFQEIDKYNFAVSSLVYSNLLEKCDNLIELGLFHAEPKDNNLNDNYFVHNPSLLRWMNAEVVVQLYAYKQDHSITDYFSYLSSPYKTGYINGDIRNSETTQKLKDENNLNKYINEHFINQSNKEYIENYELYNDLIESSNITTINPTIYNEEEIKFLEDNYRVLNNEYIYKIGDIIISRYKVLRIYSILKHSENVLIADDALMFALIKNSYINESTFNLIADAINYKHIVRSK